MNTENATNPRDQLSTVLQRWTAAHPERVIDDDLRDLILEISDLTYTLLEQAREDLEIANAYGRIFLEERIKDRELRAELEKQLRANEYHSLAMRTSFEDNRQEPRLLNAALGLAGEAGEIADYIKKWKFHGHGLDTLHLMEEAGDLQWYIVQLLDSIGISLEDCMRYNIAKLECRYKDGFSHEASKARVDKE